MNPVIDKAQQDCIDAIKTQCDGLKVVDLETAFAIARYAFSKGVMLGAVEMLGIQADRKQVTR